MSAAKHTPEPWAICPLEGHIVRPWSHDYQPGHEFKLMGDYRGGYVVDAIAERERRNESARSQQPADFARIVACVNACAGMDDPAAVIAGFRQQSVLLDALWKGDPQVQRAAPDLLAALREIDALRLENCIGPNGMAMLALWIANKAIAKAEGRS